MFAKYLRDEKTKQVLANRKLEQNHTNTHGLQRPCSANMARMVRQEHTHLPTHTHTQTHIAWRENLNTKSNLRFIRRKQRKAEVTFLLSKLFWGANRPNLRPSQWCYDSSGVSLLCEQLRVCYRSTMILWLRSPRGQIIAPEAGGRWGNLDLQRNTELPGSTSLSFITEENTESEHNLQLFVIAIQCTRFWLLLSSA